jgi:four helix bundle protein
MATITKIEDVFAWQRARELSKAIIAATGKGTFARDRALKDQILRASSSIMDNIAEGLGRSGNKEFRQALAQAKGSVLEVKSQLYTACDRNHISATERQRMLVLAESAEQLIGGFIRYLNRCELAGSKFRPDFGVPSDRTDKPKT